MAKSQRGNSINPPGPFDRESLTDYSAQIQTALDQLFTSAHDHPVLPSNPAASDGAIQQISIVDDGTNVYLVAKTRRGWFKSPNFTAI